MAEEPNSLPSPRSERGFSASPPRANAFNQTDGTISDNESVVDDRDSPRPDPVKNERGKYICNFKKPAAACQSLEFNRRCEWSKHMDKHKRPYVCDEVGCEKLRGFTYSGGLLRHKREVHKADNGNKSALTCPYPFCKRSTGSGFTRKENLNEHIRRVHAPAVKSQEGAAKELADAGAIPDAGTYEILPNQLDQIQAMGEPAKPPTKKRKRQAPAPPSPASGPDGPQIDHALLDHDEKTNLREENNRLKQNLEDFRRLIEEKDLRISKLERDVQSMMAGSTQAQYLPPQTYTGPISQTQHV